MKCYYHNEFENKQIDVPDDKEPMGFCNEQEHTFWADKHYGKNKLGKGNKRSIEDMQARFLEIAAEKRAKRLAREDI